MPELFGQWLHAVIYTGIVCSIALLLTPEGRVKKALGLICALAMCAAVASPLGELDPDAYSRALAQYRLDAQRYADRGEDYSKNLNRTVIEDECEAYILDKAEKLGAGISEVCVTAVWSSDGYWYPHELSIKTDISEEQRNELADCIAAQLGISPENQKWSVEENDG